MNEGIQETLDDLLSRIGETAHYRPGKPPRDVNEVGIYDDPPLTIIVSWREPNSLLKLISNGAKVNFKGEYGNTALHKAALRGFPEVVSTLLANGADPTIVNDDGDTPLIIALSRAEGEPDDMRFSQVLRLLKDASERWTSVSHWRIGRA